MTHMLPIPISVGKMIASNYGYDQVVIMARRCHTTPQPHGEHVTTYGRNPQHCGVAAMMGDTLKRIAQWDGIDETSKLIGDLKKGIQKTLKFYDSLEREHEAGEAELLDELAALWRR